MRTCYIAFSCISLTSVLQPSLRGCSRDWRSSFRRPWLGETERDSHTACRPTPPSPVRRTPRPCSRVLWFTSSSIRSVGCPSLQRCCWKMMLLSLHPNIIVHVESVVSLFSSPSTSSQKVRISQAIIIVWPIGLFFIGTRCSHTHTTHTHTHTHPSFLKSVGM